MVTCRILGLLHSTSPLIIKDKIIDLLPKSSSGFTYYVRSTVIELEQVREQMMSLPGP